MAKWVVEVTGLRQVVNALTEFDKKAASRVIKEITDAGKDVASDAKGRIRTRPVSNWGPFTDARTGRNLAFEPTDVASGFKVKRNNYRRRGVSAGISWDVVQTTPQGAMFEVIGNKSRVRTASGAHLVDVINSRFPGKQPRTLIPAYYSRISEKFRDEIRDQILDEARKAGLV